jgi:hypothetical protein
MKTKLETLTAVAAALDHHEKQAIKLGKAPELIRGSFCNTDVYDQVCYCAVGAYLAHNGYDVQRFDDVEIVGDALDAPYVYTNNLDSDGPSRYTVESVSDAHAPILLRIIAINDDPRIPFESNVERFVRVRSSIADLIDQEHNKI